jgi:hypothetical protein
MSDFVQFVTQHKTAVAFIVLGFLVLLFWSVLVGLLGKSSAKLDNRPRWMMGGLRDDTGSHNPKDVFGMGYGLDQTTKGVSTIDGHFDVKLGNTTIPLGGKV